MKAETKALIEDAILSRKTSLELDDMSMKLEDVEYLVRNCPQLTKLSIVLGDKKWLDILKLLPNLTHFELSHWLIYDDEIAKINQLQGLEKLRIDSEELYPKFFLGLSQLRNLKELSIVDCDYVRDESLELISKLKHLTSLELVRPSIKQSSYSLLSNLKALTSLSLEYCNLKNDALAFLHPLNNLSKLRIIGCKITNESLNSLKLLKKLTNLQLTCGWDQIDDSGIELIVELPELQELTLEGCGLISDRSLQALGRLPHLRYLYLEGNREITPEGVKSFKERAPNVQLHLENCDVVHW